MQWKERTETALRKHCWPKGKYESYLLQTIQRTKDNAKVAEKALSGAQIVGMNSWQIILNK